MNAKPESMIPDWLPAGFKRSAAITASGIKGNELKF